MSKRVHITKFGGVDGLRIDEVDIQPPGPGEVNIAVEAIGINRGDILLRQNRYIESPDLPSRMSYDAAARVTAVGKGVTGFQVGDKVMTIPAFLQSHYGVCGEDVNVPDYALWPWPDAMSAEEASCVGVQYLTAYFGLGEVGGAREGDTVLLPAATGGVGLTAIEVARELGLTIIATTRSTESVDLLRQKGADHVVVTPEEDLQAKVLEITRGKGVRTVFDPIAGATVETSLACLEQNGTLVIYGALDPNPAQLLTTELIGKNAKITAYTVFAYVGSIGLGYEQKVDLVNEAKDFLLPRLADGRLKPEVSRVFDLEDVAAAHTFLDEENKTGKVVLRTVHGRDAS
ncbi:zinc-dependent alcohol dehydrogenase family protein [uncultured Roseobacter sp.]|uniref:zinc-dependent alcohol dehydrogenase family protein n=1 Tax=uncultured Roseobacter sp. TaxID=114847 RepID=UPI002628EAE0|nr:zinc-dependent alcohol dehydrogenase family protein [uncultured Roseobacter sp.]